LFDQSRLHPSKATAQPSLDDCEKKRITSLKIACVCLHPIRSFDCIQAEELCMKNHRPVIKTCIAAVVTALMATGCGLFMSPKVVVTGPPHCCKQPVRKYNKPRPGPVNPPQTQTGAQPGHRQPSRTQPSQPQPQTSPPSATPQGGSNPQQGGSLPGGGQ
jgi:hypothetical protein